MLSSLKKPSEKSSAVGIPAWHPNFRNSSRLPDTKVVRTSFFVNGVAMFIALALTIYVVYRELELDAMRTETEHARNYIASNKAGSDQAIAQFKRFQEEEKRIFALRDFLKSSKLVLSDFVLQVGESLPPGTLISNIEYKPDGVLLSGSISGSSEEASGQSVTYVESLQKNEFFAKAFDNISLTNIVRDPSTSVLRFQIDLKFKREAPVAKGGKK